jgi:hypothetical protein
MTPTCACGQPIDDSAAYICNGCTNSLEVDLRAVPDLLVELDTTTARQTKTSGSAVGGPDCDHTRDCGCGVRLPWDDRASRVAAGLRGAVTKWVRTLVTDTYGDRCGHLSCDRATGPACWRATQIHDALTANPLTYLTANLAQIRMRQWAPNMVADLTRRVALADEATDSPEPRVYAGPCGAPTQDGPCPRRLWARQEQAAIRCPACGTTHVVTERQASLLASLSGLTLPASEIAQAVTFITRTEFSARRIRKWAHRGVLARANPAHELRALYRVADVLQLRAQGEPIEDEQRAG